MIEARQPIGVMDSGVGGLTVVRHLQRLLPGEDILYFGDSANCPYGNKSREELLALVSRMLRYFGEHHVKCVAVGCNTTSPLVGELRARFPFHITGIIESAADYVARAGLDEVGLIATEFTVKNGAYDRFIHRRAPSCRIVAEGSPLLAALIDRGALDAPELDEEIRVRVGDILRRGDDVRHLILGCTHYPIVEDHFRRCFPELTLIDPAPHQAQAVRDYLARADALNPQRRGRFTVCTTGDPAVYARAVERLGLFEPDEYRALDL